MMKELTRGLLTAILAAAALYPTSTMAQDRPTDPSLKMPTLEDLIPGGETYRYTESLYGLQWWGDACIEPGIDSLMSVNPKNGKKTLLFTRETVNRALEQAGVHKLSHLYDIRTPWPDKPEALLPASQKFAVYNWETGQVTPRGDLPKEPAANYDLNTESMGLAYTVKNNLYVNGVRVTNEPEGIVCGQSVHRNEFGITKGTFWNPQGDMIAFYRMNESMVTPYPLVDITQRIGVVDPVRYPMAGMLSHQVKVGIHTPATGRTLYLNTGDVKDRYFTNITWSPDGRSLYLIELNRDQNHAKLCRYDAESGELAEVLYEERHPKYVEPQQPIQFLPWDDTKFIYQSQRDGWNHLYLFDLGKKLAEPQNSRPATGEGSSLTHYACTPLTSGPWLVQGIVGFNAKKKEVLITATKESPLQSNLYKVNAGNGRITLLDNGQGVHNPLPSASGTYVVDNWSAPDVPRIIDIASTSDGRETARLLTAADPFEGLVMPTVETGTLKAADGVTDLHWRMLKPADFDPNKKYPVIIYVYGGPHAQMIVGNYLYAARGWDLYMANKGYILFTLDNRGSANRGLEFENCTFRHLGVEECKDQLLGVDYLKSLPYVDASRIGVHGWSFGGHMTTALMLRYPDTFKAGVAGGPVIDWQYYEIMYGERYMDTPQQNPDGYRETDLRQLAGQLRGRLLIIHDDHDDTCVPQHTLSFIKACVDARTYPDLFVYPTHKHNVLGRDRVHLHQVITRYFEDHL